jgi:DNA-binding transcriptional MerR regulator
MATTWLSIGDMARATHLSVKSLRHYHELGLLEAADVDQRTGYRRYTAEQISTAQVIRQLRDLDMPLAEIRATLTAPDLRTRNDRLVSHLRRLEAELGRTQHAVSALRDLLTPDSDSADRVAIRRVPAAPVVSITASVSAEESLLWAQGALGEIHATLAAQGLHAEGPAGGVFADELFTLHRGEMTMFVPCSGAVREAGRIRTAVLPATELAVIVHPGHPDEVSRTYGMLAAYVARHAVTVEGPIREYYLISQRESPDVTAWRTEVCWPVFQTVLPHSPPP